MAHENVELFLPEVFYNVLKHLCAVEIWRIRIVSHFWLDACERGIELRLRTCLGVISNNNQHSFTQSEYLQQSRPAHELFSLLLDYSILSPPLSRRYLAPLRLNKVDFKSSQQTDGDPRKPTSTFKTLGTVTLTADIPASTRIDTAFAEPLGLLPFRSMRGGLLGVDMWLKFCPPQIFPAFASIDDHSVRQSISNVIPSKVYECSMCERSLRFQVQTSLSNGVNLKIVILDGAGSLQVSGTPVTSTHSTSSTNAATNNANNVGNEQHNTGLYHLGVQLETSLPYMLRLMDRLTFGNHPFTNSTVSTEMVTSEFIRNGRNTGPEHRMQEIIIPPFPVNYFNQINEGIPDPIMNNNEGGVESDSEEEDI
ncbi:hypothetical protein HK098_007352 [Nowakowskiella sp. JEL0407]|nr:hypothetical protein HK098_007352 [Nowakowskiella sp. JEL0407]